MPTRELFKSFAFSLTIGMVLISGCSSNIEPQTNEVKEIPYPEPPEQVRFYFEKTLLSNLDVEFETEDSKISRYLTGTNRVGKGMLKPFDISVHKGRIFVSDPPKRTVHIFDPQEYFYGQVKAPTDSVLVKPFGIDVDEKGNLYVMDQSSGDIKIYDRDGEYLRKIGEKSLFSMPTGLAVTPDGNRVYISDTGGVSTQKHHILEMDASTGEVLRTIGTRGSKDVEFNLPKDIALDNNLLYVVDSGNFRVQVIDLATEKLVLKFGSIGRQAGHFSRPRGISIDNDKNIYVSDAAFGNFQIFNKQGQLLLFIGERSDKLYPGHYMLNSGIAVDEDGRILMADQFHRKVDIFRPAALDKTQGYLGVLSPPTDKEYQAIKAKKN
ncbi:hypothetical protein [Thalassotalea sp. G2M2-11]|uniref:hypothetical protein n=1 Tax=Thalassotalea sp. G2M2-11 TaxID=2787627 RepID=UPI0019D1F9C2|nr:hypothetical protein [Thalassotalea sp. G2M2-11]